MSQSAFAPSKRVGANAESAVIETVDGLEHVPDTDAEHYDARVCEPISPTPRLPFVAMCVLEVGTAVEIKSASVVYGESQANGRFYLREQQHARLVDERGSYLFAVCEPKPARPLIAMKVVPATIVGDIVPSWRDAGDGRPACAQISWSKIFEPGEIYPAEGSA